MFYKSKELLFLLHIIFFGVSNAKPEMIKFRNVNTAFYGGTHMSPLITAVMNTCGPVVELGCGDFSTPLLHAICSTQKRYLLSLDNDAKWLNHFLDLENDFHVIKYTPKMLDFLKHNNQHWSVVFVDQAPGEERAISMELLKNHTDIFVMHDSETQCYGYSRILTGFKYVYIYERYNVTTTIASNIIDVKKWFVE